VGRGERYFCNYPTQMYLLILKVWSSEQNLPFISCRWRRRSGMSTLMKQQNMSLRYAADGVQPLNGPSLYLGKGGGITSGNNGFVVAASLD
jgi:hypothetical protein